MVIKMAGIYLNLWSEFLKLRICNNQRAYNLYMYMSVNLIVYCSTPINAKVLVTIMKKIIKSNTVD